MTFQVVYLLIMIPLSSSILLSLSLPSPSSKKPLFMSKSGTVLRSINRDKPTQEWDVKRYQDQHSFVWHYGSSLVDLLQAKPGQVILDVGCGTGELTEAIACSSTDSSSIHVIGMDSDLRMIEKAKLQYPNLTFFPGDVRNFSMLEGPVDAIFSNAALHWVPPTDVERSVVAMSNALKMGGRFVVEFGGRGNVQIIVRAIQEELPGKRTTNPWYFPSIAEYSGILEKHGIEVLDASLFDRPTPLENDKEGIKNWLRMFGGAFFDGMDEGEIDSVLNRIQEALSPHLYDDTTGTWIADYRRIRIVGQKVSCCSSQ